MGGTQICGVRGSVLRSFDRRREQEEFFDERNDVYHVFHKLGVCW